jgi:hypothetical protein
MNREQLVELCNNIGTVSIGVHKRQLGLLLHWMWKCDEKDEESERTESERGEDPGRGDDDE